METLEHFEDNLNTNITNSKLLEKFINHAIAVKHTFSDKFHNGEFEDPALKKDEWINNILYTQNNEEIIKIWSDY